MDNKSVLLIGGERPTANILPFRERPTDAHARLDHNPEQNGTVDREVPGQEEEHQSDHVPRHPVRVDQNQAPQDQVDREGGWLQRGCCRPTFS